MCLFYRVQVVFFWFLILELPLWNIRYGFLTLSLLKQAGKCIAAVFADAAYLKHCLGLSFL